MSPEIHFALVPRGYQQDREYWRFAMTPDNIVCVLYHLKLIPNKEGRDEYLSNFALTQLRLILKHLGGSIYLPREGRKSATRYKNREHLVKDIYERMN